MVCVNDSKVVLHTTKNVVDFLFYGSCRWQIIYFGFFFFFFTLETFFHFRHRGQLCLVTPEQRIHGHDEAWGAKAALRTMSFG